MASKLKNIIIFLIIGAAMVAGYMYFFSGGEETPSLVSDDGTPVIADTTGENTTPTEQDFLPVLLNVKRIRLDDAILSDPAFLTLRDSTIILVPDGSEGRPNPFAPLSASNANTSSITGPTVSGTNIPLSAEAASAANTIDVTNSFQSNPQPTTPQSGTAVPVN